eukprot:1705094-Amphidinium_carterae.1
MTRLLVDAQGKAVKHSLASIFAEFNKAKLSPETDESGRAAEALQKQPPAKKQMPRVERDSTWLAETSSRTAEALCAVLQSTKSPLSSMWVEKAGVRRSTAQLCLTVLGGCRAAFQSSGQHGEQ